MLKAVDYYLSYFTRTFLAWLKVSYALQKEEVVRSNNYSTSLVDSAPLMTTHIAAEATNICCQSWMLIHNCSCSRHLIQWKNHEFLWVNKSTCQIDRTALMRIQKRQIPKMMSLPKSWPLNRDGSCRRHLIQCKNHGFRLVNNSTSEPKRLYCS